MNCLKAAMYPNYKGKQKCNKTFCETLESVCIHFITVTSLYSHHADCSLFLICWRRQVSNLFRFQAVALSSSILRRKDKISPQECKNYGRTFSKDRFALHQDLNIPELQRKTQTFPSSWSDWGSHVFCIIEHNYNSLSILDTWYVSLL